MGEIIDPRSPTERRAGLFEAHRKLDEVYWRRRKEEPRRVPSIEENMLKAADAKAAADGKRRIRHRAELDREQDEKDKYSNRY